MSATVSGTACARRRSGQVSCWGSNASGTLGAGIPFATLASSNAPRDAMGLGDATALAGGAGFEVVRAGPSLGRPGPILTETLRLGTAR